MKDDVQTSREQQETQADCTEIAPEFTTYTPDAEGWSGWICPSPDSYLMKCCDCGLVHELQFRVAKYEPRPSVEHKIVDDPDTQTQFRARRSLSYAEWASQPAEKRGGPGQPID